ncbi:MAG: hypothetical protein KTR30_18740 [Saprospiraceae bacterium]|nr:hypothetical protein [Saprospiraceae bacterium]
MLKTLPLFTLLLLLAGCKTYSTDELPDTRLYFGSGGGFAGAYTEYMLLENGQLFKRESQQGTFVVLPKAKRSQAKALFASWTEQKMEEQDFQHPGNLYHFVRMEKGAQSHRLSWGSSSHPTPDAVKSFYASCKTLIPKPEPLKQ